MPIKLTFILINLLVTNAEGVQICIALALLILQLQQIRNLKKTEKN